MFVNSNIMKLKSINKKTIIYIYVNYIYNDIYIYIYIYIYM